MPAAYGTDAKRALVPARTAAHHALMYASPLAMFRLARVAMAIVTGLGILLLPHLAWRVATRGAPSPFARAFQRLVMRSMGLKVEVRGVAFADRALIVANHISWTDILVLGAATRTAFVARADLRGWPFFGLLARLSGTIFVERGKRQAVKSQVETIAAALPRGRVTLFPEGTTGSGNAVLPFRSTLFDAAGSRPVQPVAITYRPRGRAGWDPVERAAFAWDGDKPLLSHLLAVIAAGGARCRILVLPPLPPCIVDRKARALQARVMIDAALSPCF